jgi:hypothetical protein
MEPVFAAQGRWAHRALAPIIVDFHDSVLQLDFQPTPLAQGIVASLGQFAAGRDGLPDRHQAVFQRYPYSEPRVVTASRVL